MPTQADLDAARRLSDTVSLHLVADFERAIRSVIVVNLADGSSDGTLYDSWDDACAKGAGRLDPRWWAPVRITPDGINERDARLLLRVMRQFPGIKTVPEPILQTHLHPPGGRRLHP